MKTLSLIAVMLTGCLKVVPMPVVEPLPIKPFAPVELDKDAVSDDDEGSLAHNGHPSSGSGGAIKVWGSGETLTASNLNSNFTHIHNNMVGNHGARLMDADINASANINSSKLAAYRFIPVAWGSIAQRCIAPGACVMWVNSPGVSVSRTAIGDYTVTMPTRTDDMYTVVLSNALAGDTGTNPMTCIRNQGVAATTTTFNVRCYETITSPITNDDNAFDFVVLDDN